MQRAFATDAKVRFVENPDLLAEMDGVLAALRYKADSPAARQFTRRAKGRRMSKNNVHPDHYKVGGRDRQDDAAAARFAQAVAGKAASQQRPDRMTKGPSSAPGARGAGACRTAGEARAKKKSSPRRRAAGKSAARKASAPRKTAARKAASTSKRSSKSRRGKKPGSAPARSTKKR